MVDVSEVCVLTLALVLRPRARYTSLSAVAKRQGKFVPPRIGGSGFGPCRGQSHRKLFGPWRATPAWLL